MAKNELSRRKFIGKASAGIAGAAVSMGAISTAASFKRVIGANDRINSGITSQWLPGGFDFYKGMKETIKNGKAEIVTTPEYDNKLGPVNLSDNSKFHLDNWIDCMRERNPNTNGHIHTGFWHSITSIMATRAYREGKKLYWDRNKEEIVDHPVNG